MCNSFLLRSCPGGTFDDSPAIHRWESRRCPAVPEGRLKTIESSAVPDGTRINFQLGSPAMNRWATFNRP